MGHVVWNIKLILSVTVYLASIIGIYIGDWLDTVENTGKIILLVTGIFAGIVMLITAIELYKKVNKS